MPRVYLTAALLAALLVGCHAEPAPQQFQTYDQLLSQEQADSPAPAADAAPMAPTAEVAVMATDVPNPSQPTESQPVESTAPADSPEATAEIPASALAPLNIVDGSNTSDILKVADGRPAASLGMPAIAPAVALPGGVRLLIPTRSFKTEGPKEALRVSYDDLDLLKVLNMEPVPDDATRFFPDWLSALNGSRVRIRGFMYPTFESSGIEQFVLARDNQICCFGRDPKVYDLIAVTMLGGKTTDYIPNRPFDVVGTFRIDLLADGGKPLGLYWLEDAEVLDR